MPVRAQDPTLDPIQNVTATIPKNKTEERYQFQILAIFGTRRLLKTSILLISM
jgi:hypothetical protein